MINTKRGKKANSHFDFLIKSNLAKSKRSQVLGMPFSVIFSIILIVSFIAAAIIAIKIFYNPCGCGFNEQANEATFKQDIQEQVDDVWSNIRADKAFSLNVHSCIKKICFLDLENPAKGTDAGLYDELSLYDGNTFLYPLKSACAQFKSFNLKHVNITETAKNSNPYCVKNGEKIWIASLHGGPARIYQK